ncbi:MAG: Tex-like N-terminal domain-containing protein, partial [Dolichospermum sp.]
MLNISQLLASELKHKPHQVQNALELLAEGATIPF